MRKTILIALLLSGCTNIACDQAARGIVDNATFEQCIKEETAKLPPTWTLSPPAIDGCAKQALEVNKMRCGAF